VLDFVPHLLVPGGRWLTVISRPSLLTSFCSSRFHSRTATRSGKIHTSIACALAKILATLPRVARPANFDLRLRKFSRSRLFRLSGAEFRRRNPGRMNPGRIGGLA
jgi:hypothetical protein